MGKKEFASMVAADIMVTRLVTLSPNTDVFKGIDTLVKNKISGAPVVDSDRRLLGVFSEKCCMHVLMDAVYDGLPTNHVGAFMDTEPLSVQEDTSMMTLANCFMITPRRRVQVLRDGILVGQISRRDVIKAANGRSKQPSPSKKLLYLSALREMEDAPMVG